MRKVLCIKYKYGVLPDHYYEILGDYDYYYQLKAEDGIVRMYEKELFHLC